MGPIPLHQALLSFSGCANISSLTSETNRNTGECYYATRWLLLSLYLVRIQYLTLCWSDTDQSLSSLARRPFNILLLFLAFGILEIKTPGKLFKVFSIAAKVAVVSGLLSLIYLLLTHFTNGGDLSYPCPLHRVWCTINPLLTSHVYGFFAAFFLALWFSGRYSHSPSLHYRWGFCSWSSLAPGHEHLCSH